jgi:hypothetical protein
VRAPYHVNCNSSTLCDAVLAAEVFHGSGDNRHAKMRIRHSKLLHSHKSDNHSQTRHRIDTKLQQNHNPEDLQHAWRKHKHERTPVHHGGGYR